MLKPFQQLNMEFSLKAINFNYFAFLGISVHLFPIYLQENGFNREDISFIQTVIPLVQTIVILFSGYLSDVFNVKERLLRWLTLISFLLSMAYFFVDSLLGLIILNFALSLFRGPVIPLVDSSTLDYIAQHTKDYGKIRLWGSIGFIGGTVITGILLDFGTNIITLYMMSFFLFLTFFYAQSIPTKVKKQNHIAWAEIKLLISDRQWVMLILTGFLHSLSLAAYHLYFSLYMTDLDFSITFVGVAVMVAVLSEVILLYYSKAILAKYNSFALLSFVFFISSLRWFMLSLFQNEILILLSQTIHAFSFGLFFLVSMNFSQHHFKDHLRSTGITLFSTLVFGLSGILGSLLSGQWVKTEFYDTLFFYCGILTLLTFIISLNFSFRDTKNIQ